MPQITPFWPTYPQVSRLPELPSLLVRNQELLATWQRIAASIAQHCGLRPLGLCDIYCRGTALCDTTGLRPCCPLPGAFGGILP